MQHLFYFRSNIKTVLFTGLVLLALKGYCQHNKQISWPQYMQQQTLHWDTICTNYYTGIILGNGLLGANIYKEDGHAIRFDVGRTDITDERQHTTDLFTASLYNAPRLPIGRMTMQTAGEITGASMNLDIFNAIASGTIYTSAGSINFTAFVAASKDVISITANGTGGEKHFTWKWIAEKSIGPRLQYPGITPPAGYQDNPPFELKDSAGLGICEQKLLNGHNYTTVWKEQQKNDQKNILITTGPKSNSQINSQIVAVNTLNSFSKAGYNNMLNEHRLWWNAFYKKSFVSLPDRRMESFYWIQLYKLASATRQDKPVIDLMGPWFTSNNPWGGIWWNLNIQLTYSPLYTANHLELAKPYNKIFSDNLQNLVANVPEKWRYNSAAIGRVSSYDLLSPLRQEDLSSLQFEPGNLTWALFYYYQEYLYTKDTTELTTKIYPLLKRAVNYLIHLLEPDSAGILHLPMSASPEYKNAVDANYTLASLRWGLETLLATNNGLRLNDKDENIWNTTLTKLVPYPVNKNGYMIGKDVELTSSHRHYAHLLMIHPYHTVNWEQTENRNLITTSLENWLSRKKGLAGFSFTEAASMYAAIADGDNAYKWLNELFDRFMHPNTLYEEAGPVIETPLAAATSIQEMLLQSWGCKIRIFPAIPVAWQNIAFDHLLAEGAFTVSAKRENSKTSFVKIKSVKGGLCVVQTDMESFQISSDKRKQPAYTTTAYENKSIIKMETLPGETILFVPTTGKADQSILPVANTINKSWSWGMKRK